MMQGGAAVGSGAGEIGAIGDQGHHHIRATDQGIATGQQQRRHAMHRQVRIGATLDQGTQQAQIGMTDRTHQRAALIAIVATRQYIRIGTGSEQFQRLADIAVGRRIQQGGIATGMGMAGKHILLRHRLAHRRIRLRHLAGDLCINAGGLQLGFLITEQQAFGTPQHQQMCQRTADQGVDPDRQLTQFARQGAAQTSNRQRRDDQQQQGNRHRDATAETVFMHFAGEMPRKTRYTSERSEDPRAATGFRIGIVPDQGQAEHRPQPDQGQQGQQKSGRQQHRVQRTAFVEQAQCRRTDHHRHPTRIQGQPDQQHRTTPQDHRHETVIELIAERQRGASSQGRLCQQQQDQDGRMIDEQCCQHQQHARQQRQHTATQQGHTRIRNIHARSVMRQRAWSVKAARADVNGKLVAIKRVRG